MRSPILRLHPVLVVVIVAVLSALTVPAAAGATSEPASSDTPTIRPLPTGTDVDYQLGGPHAVPPHVGIVERDRTAAPLAGRYDICYVNGFQTQDDERAFWHRDGRWRLVLKDHGRAVVDGEWGEWLLDLRTPAKRAALARIMGRWVAGCARSGYQAVEYDNLDSFTRSHHLMDRRDAVAYARRLVAIAHRDGLAAGQKNLAGWDGRTVGYDFAVAEQCADYDECGDYVADYGDRVLVVEYDGRHFRTACREYGDRLAIVRRDLDLRPSFHPRYC